MTKRVFGADLFVSGIVGENHIVKPKADSQQYTISIKNPKFTDHLGNDDLNTMDIDAKTMINGILTQGLIREDSEHNKVIILKESRKNPVEHIRCYDLKTRTEIPIHHDLAQGQKVTVFMTVRGTVMYIHDIIISDISKVRWN